MTSLVPTQPRMCIPYLITCALVVGNAVAWKQHIAHTTRDTVKTMLRNARVLGIASSVILSSLAPVVPPVYASNAEAIEVRRVLEQPVGAPMPERSPNVKLESGLQYYDATVGDGAVVEEGKTVQFQWVLRRQNGYFVDASSNYGSEPFIYKVGNLKKVIKGVDEGIRGMRVGGVRRLLIPASLAYVQGVGDGLPGPMPDGFGPRRQIETRREREVWYMELQVAKVR